MTCGLPLGALRFELHVAQSYETYISSWCVSTITVMVRRDAPEDALRFPEDMSTYEGVDCFARLARSGMAGFIDCSTRCATNTGRGHDPCVEPYRVPRPRSTNVALEPFVFDCQESFDDLLARTSRHFRKELLLGVNLSYVVYRNAIAWPSPECRRRDGVRWTVMLRDGRDSFNDLRRGELTLREWLGPLRAVRVDAYLPPRDPRLGAREIGRLGVRLLRRGLRSARGGQD
jgi:hypothetical protein